MPSTAHRFAALVAVLCVIVSTGTLAAGAAPDPPRAANAWCPTVASRPDPPPVARITDRTGAQTAVSTPLQLVRADYDVSLFGTLASGNLTLEFLNPSDMEVRAVYRHDTPLGVTVDTLEATIDGNAEPIETQRSGREASPRAAGRTNAARRAAAPAPRPTIPLPAAVPPGETVTLRVGFRTEARFETDRFVLRLPATTGCTPPARAADRADAPPVAAPLGVSVTVHQDEPLELAQSATHDVIVSFDGTASTIETTLDEPTGRNEFRLEYALGAPGEPRLLGYAGPQRNGERDVVVVLAPNLDPPDDSIRPKEALFLLDTSGSMKGDKIESARHALASCLDKLGAADRFNIVEFDAAHTALHEKPVEASGANVHDSLNWLAAQRAMGATRLAPALEATLTQVHDATLHRMVIVITDGMIQNEAQAIGELQQNLGEARLFIVGIGTNAKRDTIQRLAETGRGTAVFADDAEAIEGTVARLFDGVSAPLAWDLSLDWGPVEVLKMEPRRLPDLYAGRPVTIRARVRGELPAMLTLEARTMEGTRYFEVEMPAGGAPEYPELAPVRPSPEKPRSARPRGR